MVKLYASACIAATAPRVWAQLAQLEDIQRWSDAVVSACCAPGRAHGVGAERTCALVGGRTIVERWVAWDEGRSYQYEGVGPPLVRRASNRWTVQPAGDKTLLISEAEVEFKGGPFGRVLGLAMAPLLRHMAPGALASFKYLVEHGAAYAGKASELPRPTVSC